MNSATLREFMQVVDAIRQSTGSIRQYLVGRGRVLAGQLGQDLSFFLDDVDDVPEAGGSGEQENVICVY